MTNTMPDAGDAAPAFSGPTASGDTLSLSDFQGRWLLLYFYPKDDTPGCTKQACNLRDNLAVLEAENIAVVGVSGDDVASHERFAAKYDLPFPLLADPDRTVLEAYGVWGEKNFYGKKLVGLKRTSFLIDPEGVVRHVFKRPKTGAHAQEVLAKRDALAA